MLLILGVEIIPKITNLDIAGGSLYR